MRRAKSDLPIPKISNTQAAYCLASIGAGLLLFVLGRASVAISNRPPAQDISQWTASFKEPDTLVVYAYANRDWEYPRNLAFFVRHGIKENDGADYVIILEQSDHPLHAPPFPPFVRQLVKEGECYSWGAFGWMLNSGKINIKRYSYFVLVDASVRGPFISPYVPKSIPWHRMLTRRLSATTKLVGPVISCEGAPFKGRINDKWKLNPAVQSYAVAMDQEALKIIRRDSEITQCYWDKWDSHWHGELGASAAILNAGYNIDSFIHRFQGVNWRDKKNWGCNQKLNPTGEKWMDGITISPHELMFVKVKDHLLLSTNSLAIAAAKYSDWMDGMLVGERDIFTNQFIEKPEEYKAPLVAMMKARSPQCFDHGFYRDANWDLNKDLSKDQSKPIPDEQLWHHFIHSGQFEARPHRWFCSWEVPPEMLDVMDRYHEMRHPYVKRNRDAASIEAASSAKPKEREKLSSELELLRLRTSIV